MRTRTILFALAALLAAGCGLVPVVDPGSDPGAGSEPTGRPTRTAAAGESLEGKFNYRTMDDYVNAVTPMITQWLEETWPGMPLPNRVLYVPRGASGPEDCLDPSGRAAIYTSGSYEYCPAEQTIYVGQDILWTFYDRTGDAGPAVGLAHEFGHHIQVQVGVPSPRTAEDSVRHENQADCLAGAWTQYTDQQGWLEYPDDIQDIDALFPLIGSAETLDRDHGTPQERKRAFQRGFDGGVRACEAFYPSVPLT